MREFVYEIQARARLVVFHRKSALISGIENRIGRLFRISIKPRSPVSPAPS
jgi:hypothetical protein